MEALKGSRVEAWKRRTKTQIVFRKFSRSAHDTASKLDFGDKEAQKETISMITRNSALPAINRASFTMKFSPSQLLIVAGLLLATGCGTLRQDDSAVTTLKLSGPVGARFTGYIVQYSERVKISGVTPWTYQGQGITGFEISKGNRDMAMDLETTYDEGNGARTTQAIGIPAGMSGVHGEVMNHGMDMELVR